MKDSNWDNAAIFGLIFSGFLLGAVVMLTIFSFIMNIDTETQEEDSSDYTIDTEMPSGYMGDSDNNAVIQYKGNGTRTYVLSCGEHNLVLANNSIYCEKVEE